MNDEHIKEIVKKMPDLFNPTTIQEAVEDYLDKHPVSGADVPTTDIDFSNLEGGDN